MNTDYRSFCIRAKTATPLFIGSGESIDKMSYNLREVSGVYDLSVFDNRALVDYLRRNDLLDEYCKFIAKNTSTDNRQFKLFFDERKKEGRMSRFPLKEITKYRIDNVFYDGKNGSLNEISLFIKDGVGAPYIPGSSLKGALRTAIIGQMIKTSRSVRDDAARSFKKGGSYQSFERSLMHTDSQREIDTMNAVSVSDSQSFSFDELRIVRRFDYGYSALPPKEMPLYLEAIRSGLEFSFTIRVNIGLLKARGVNFCSGAEIEAALMNEWRRYYEALALSAADEAYIGDVSADKLCMTVGASGGYHSKTVTKSLFSGEELVEQTKFILHKKDGLKIMSHKNDKAHSPRTLKLVNDKDKTNSKGFSLCGIVEVMGIEEQ